MIRGTEYYLQVRHHRMTMSSNDQVLLIHVAQESTLRCLTSLRLQRYQTKENPAGPCLSGTDSLDSTGPPITTHSGRSIGKADVYALSGRHNNVALHILIRNRRCPVVSKCSADTFLWHPLHITASSRVSARDIAGSDHAIPAATAVVLSGHTCALHNPNS